MTVPSTQLPDTQNADGLYLIYEIIKGAGNKGVNAETLMGKISGVATLGELQGVLLDISAYAACQRPPMCLNVINNNITIGHVNNTDTSEPVIPTRANMQLLTKEGRALYLASKATDPDLEPNLQLTALDKLARMNGDFSEKIIVAHKTQEELENPDEDLALTSEMVNRLRLHLTEKAKRLE